MSPTEIQMVIERLQALENAISELSKKVANLIEHRIRNEQKRLECEDHFDSKYIKREDFGLYIDKWYSSALEKQAKMQSKTHFWISVIVVIVLAAVTILKYVFGS